MINREIINLRLTHLTQTKEFNLDKKKDYSNTKGGYFKPLGLWLSVGKDWERWLKNNWKQYLIEHKYTIKFKFKTTPNLLIFNTINDIQNKWNELMPNNSLINYDNVEIFNKLIVKIYDGVYMKSSALYGNEYSSCWDCESICLWNLKNIHTITKGDNKQ